MKFADRDKGNPYLAFSCTVIVCILALSIIGGLAQSHHLDGYRDAPEGGSAIVWDAPVIRDNYPTYFVRTVTYHGITDSNLTPLREDPYIPHIQVCYFDRLAQMPKICVPYLLGPVIDSIMDTIRECEDLAGRTYTDYDTALLVLNFVNAIDYALDERTYGTDEYWATPAETLYAGRGDCEDHSALFVTLCRCLGLDAVLAVSEGHVQAGIRLDGDGVVVDGYSIVECCYCDHTRYLYAYARDVEDDCRILKEDTLAGAVNGLSAYVKGWRDFISLLLP